jgi:hypothetical protein
VYESNKSARGQEIKKLREVTPFFCQLFPKFDFDIRYIKQKEIGRWAALAGPLLPGVLPSPGSKPLAGGRAS